MTHDTPIEDGEVEIPLRFTGLEEGRASADAIFGALSRNAEKFQEKLDAFKRQFNDIARLTDPAIAMNAAAGAIGMSSGQRIGAGVGGSGGPANFGNFGNVVGSAIERSIKQATGGYSPTLRATPDATLQQLLQQSLHPKTELPFGSMGKLQRETDGLAGVFHRLSMASGNLGEGMSAASKRLASSSGALFNVLRQSAFGRSLGLRAMGPDGKLQAMTPENFARALGRFMSARAIGAPLNALWESAKNPLQDNFHVQRAQNAANSALNTLATTGSPLAAALSGLGSVLMSNIQRRNDIHVQQYQFDQRSLDTRRSFAQRTSDWSFEQILSMTSRPNQLRMLQGRADRIHGIATPESIEFDSGGDVARAKQAEQDALSRYNGIMQKITAAKMAAFQVTHRNTGAGSNNGPAGFGAGNFGFVNPLGSQILGALNQDPNVPEEMKAVAAAKERLDAQVKASEKSKKVAEKEEKVADEKSKALDAELKAALESKPEYDPSLEGREKKLAKDEEAVARHEKRMREGHLAKRFWQGEDGRLLTDSQHSALRKKQLADDLKDLDENGRKKWGGYSKDTFKEVTEQEILNQKRNRIAKERQDIADSRAEAENKRSERINAAYDAKDAYEAQKRQEELDKRIAGRDKAAERAAEVSRKLARGETVKIEHDEKWYKDRNLDTKTGKSLIAHDPAVEATYTNINRAVAETPEAKAAREAYEEARSFTTSIQTIKPGDYYSDIAKTWARYQSGEIGKNESYWQSYKNSSFSKEANELQFGRLRKENLATVAKALGKNAGDVTFQDLESAMNDAGRPMEIRNLSKSLLADSGKFTQDKKFADDIIRQIKRGEFRHTDMASLKAAIEIGRMGGDEEGALDPNKDANFKKIQDMYNVQETRRGELEFRKFQMKNDTSMITAKMLDGGQTADSMARQGFFVGNQISVATVNENILAEVRKMIPILTKMAGKEVGYSDVGFLSRTDFK